MNPLTPTDASAIAEILKRRANEIASFKYDLEQKLSEQMGKPFRIHDLPGSVDLALDREIQRLRALEIKIKPPEPEED